MKMPRLDLYSFWLKGNPAFVADQKGVFPLHIACEFSSLKVVQFLVELCGDGLRSGTTNNMMLVLVVVRARMAAID